MDTFIATLLFNAWWELPTAAWLEHMEASDQLVPLVFGFPVWFAYDRITYRK